MFSTGLLGKKHGSKMVQPFIEIGHSFGKYGYFHESIIVEYASPEYLSEKQIRLAVQLAAQLQTGVGGFAVFPDVPQMPLPPQADVLLFLCW